LSQAPLYGSIHLLAAEMIFACYLLCSPPGVTARGRADGLSEPEGKDHKHLFSVDSMCFWCNIVLQGEKKEKDSHDKKHMRMRLLLKTSMPRFCCHNINFQLSLLQGEVVP
jgi:hypothetical protein